MAYTPTEWSNGDVITAEKLNKIEAGIENNNMIQPIKFYETVDPVSGTSSYQCTLTYGDIEQYRNIGILLIPSYGSMLYISESEYKISAQEVGVFTGIESGSYGINKYIFKFEGYKMIFDSTGNITKENL